MRKLLLMLTAMGLLLVAAKAEPTIIGERDGKDVVTVRAGEATQSKQGLPNFVGISGASRRQASQPAQGRHSAWWFRRGA